MRPHPDDPREPVPWGSYRFEMTRRHGGALVKVMAVVSVVVSLPLAVASVVFWRTLTEDVGIPWPVLLIPFVAPVVVVGIGASVVGAVRRMEP